MRHLKQVEGIIDNFTAAIIVAEESMEEDVIQADAHSLATLLSVKKLRLESMATKMRDAVRAVPLPCASVHEASRVPPCAHTPTHVPAPCLPRRSSPPLPPFLITACGRATAAR